MAGRIRAADVEEVRRKAALVDVAAEYMQLRKAGSGRFKARCPFHQEKTPSFSIDAAKGLFHCLAAETSVLTWEGAVPIEKLTGETHRLMTTGGKWVDAEVKSFGVQQLWAVDLTRNRVKKTVHATDGHRWLLRRGAGPGRLVERVTSALSPGDPLAWAFHNAPGVLKTGPAPFGVAHGFTFGDGTRTPSGSSAQFAGEKDPEMLRFFPEAAVWTKGRLRVGRLPLFFKDFPPIGEALPYLCGWLAGLFAADGCVSTDGQVILSSASREVLEFVRTVANRLGIGTYGIKHQSRLGLGKVPSDLFHVTFINSTLHRNFFVLSKHRKRFDKACQRPRVERKGWVVENVIPTDRVEEVFCAVVPGAHAFVLEDNILIGNCFGCSKGGDVITLVSELENLTFAETVERLAARVGVQLTYERVSPAEREASGRKQRLIAAHKEAIAFYHDLLMGSPEGKIARDYFKGRGLSKETVEGFRLGWAPPRWEDLSRLLLRKRFTEAELIEAGLSLRSDRGGLIDRFRGRVMFPTFDVAGEPVGFGGRVLDDSTPKYLNTAETPIHRKGLVLYGLERAKGSISKTARAIIVEGYMDVIALHQAGVTEAIATNGTALSLEHFRLLMRFAPQAIVAFDSDRAGASAVERAFEHALSSGIDARVLILPDGKDPADVAIAGGGDAFRELTARAVPMVEYRLRREIARFDLSDPEGRSRAVRAGIPVLARVTDEVMRRDYTGKLAEWTHEDPSAVFLAVGRVTGDPASRSAPNVRRASAQVRLERDLLKLALQYPAALEGHRDGVEPDMFAVRAHRAIWIESTTSADAAALVDRLADEEARKALTELVNDPIECDLDPDGTPPQSFVAEVVNRMKDFALRKIIEEKKDTLQRINPLEDPVEYRKLYAELISLEGEHKRVSLILDSSEA